MMKCKRKPLVVEAYKTEVIRYLRTKNGELRADPGDWIITGVDGEQYPCKPEIFERSYEFVEVNEKIDL